MAKFLLLYIGGRMPETEAESAEAIKDWTAWYTSLGSAVVDPGSPFTPTARTVTHDGRVRNRAAGAMATGYTILEAGQLKEAVKMAKSCPVLKGGARISVYETFEVA